GGGAPRPAGEPPGPGRRGGASSGAGPSGGSTSATPSRKDRTNGGGVLAGIARLAVSFEAVGRSDAAGTVARLDSRPPISSGIEWPPRSAGERLCGAAPGEAIGRRTPRLLPRRKSSDLRVSEEFVASLERIPPLGGPGA